MCFREGWSEIDGHPKRKEAPDRGVRSGASGGAGGVLLGLVSVEPATESAGPGDGLRPGSGAATGLGVRAVGLGLLQSQAPLEGPTPDASVLIHSDDLVFNHEGSKGSKGCLRSTRTGMCFQLNRNGSFAILRLAPPPPVPDIRNRGVCVQREQEPGCLRSTRTGTGVFAFNENRNVFKRQADSGGGRLPHSEAVQR